MVEPLQIDGTETCISSHLTATKKRPRSTTIYSEEEAYSARIISSVPPTSEHKHMTVSTGIIMTRRDSYYPKPLFDPSHDQNMYSDSFATSRPNTNKLLSSVSTQYKSLRNSVHVPPTILEEHSVHPPAMMMMTPSPSLENIMSIDTVTSFAASDSIQSFILNATQEHDFIPTNQGPSQEEDEKSLNPVSIDSAWKHHTLHDWNSMFHTIG
jgi:hypothetical protein